MNTVFAFIIRYLYALITSIYLFTLGFIFTKNRFLITTICAHFGYVKKPYRNILPQVFLSEIVPDNIPIKILEPLPTDGNMSLLEIVIINKLISIHKPQRLFEIGTFDGRTTLNMAANSPAKSKVYTLDLPQESLSSALLPLAPGDKKFISKPASGSRYKGTKYGKKIVSLFGDSAAFNFKPYANSLDFVVIDGSHSLAYTLNDTARALSLLKKNGKGIILWHDYDAWEGVTQGLNKLYLQGGRFKRLRQIKNTSLVIL